MHMLKATSRSNSRANSKPTKLERTGKTTFAVYHDDGSIFECKIDLAKVRFAEDARRTASRFHVAKQVRLRNLMSNADRVRLGLEPDPDLPK